MSNWKSWVAQVYPLCSNAKVNVKEEFVMTKDVSNIRHNFLLALVSEFARWKTSAQALSLLLFPTKNASSIWRQHSQKALVARDSPWVSPTTIEPSEEWRKHTVDLGCSALLISYEEGCNDRPDIISSSFLLETALRDSIRMRLDKEIRSLGFLSVLSSSSFDRAAVKAETFPAIRSVWLISHCVFPLVDSRTYSPITIINTFPMKALKNGQLFLSSRFHFRGLRLPRLKHMSIHIHLAQNFDEIPYELGWSQV